MEHFSASPDQHSNVSIQVIIKREDRKDQGRRSYLQHEVTWKELHKLQTLGSFLIKRHISFNMSLFLKIETKYKDSKSQDILRFRNDQHYVLERNGVLIDYATNLSLSLSLYCSQSNHNQSLKATVKLQNHPTVIRKQFSFLCGFCGFN